jgi:ElaB/YqjD/DUF883 family membrane-anchored ribosome-binding protein
MQNTTGMQGSTQGAAGTAEKLAEQASAGLGRLSDTAQQTMGRVSEVASQAASRLSERGRELYDMRGEYVDTARTYVREHPVAAIGIAIAIGLLISRLTSRR